MVLVREREREDAIRNNLNLTDTYIQEKKAGISCLVLYFK